MNSSDDGNIMLQMKTSRLMLLVLGFLGLQLSLVAEGIACPGTVHTASRPVQAGAANAAMAEMAMSSPGTPTPENHECDKSGALPPCNAPGSCAVAFTTTITDRTSAPVTASEMLALIVIAPTAPVLKPELPPPRA